MWVTPPPLPAAVSKQIFRFHEGALNPSGTLQLGKGLPICGRPLQHCRQQRHHRRRARLGIGLLAASRGI